MYEHTHILYIYIYMRIYLIHICIYANTCRAEHTQKEAVNVQKRVIRQK